MPAPELAADDVRLAALLRGVNVGGRNIPMYELRDVVGTLDVRNVRTVLASGNVLLDTSASTPVATTRELLEQAIGERFSYEALVAVLPLPLVEELVAGAPWTDDDAWHTYVVLSTAPGLLREATSVTEEQLATEAATGEPPADEPRSGGGPDTPAGDGRTTVDGNAADDEETTGSPRGAADHEPGAGAGAGTGTGTGTGTSVPNSPALGSGRLAEVRERAATRRTLADSLAANEAAVARVTELRLRTGRTEVCSVVAASFLVGGAERDEASGELVESWQHPGAGLAARLEEIGLDALWWRCPRGSSLSTPLARTLARSRFARTTTRNVRTLRRFA